MYPEFELPADQKKAWLADRVGRDRRRRLAEAVRLEGRRPRPAPCSPIYRAARRRAVGVQHRRHLRLGEAGRRQDAVLLPLRLPERGAAQAARHGRPGRVVRHQGRRSGDVATSSPRRSTRCSRTRRPKPRRRPRRPSSPDFAKQIGDIGSIMIGHHGRRHVLHPASSPAMPWRNRCASAPTSWAVLEDARLRRRPDPRRWCCSSRAPSPWSAAGSGCSLVVDDHHRRGDPTGGLLPIFHLPVRAIWSLGRGRSSLVLGVGTGLLPALQASRLKIVDALRRATELATACP